MTSTCGGENRSRAIDTAGVAQRIRPTVPSSRMQDTSTDYEELANSIQAGYFIKNGIANYNEDLFYLECFHHCVRAQTHEELLYAETPDDRHAQIHGYAGE